MTSLSLRVKRNPLFIAKLLILKSAHTHILHWEMLPDFVESKLQYALHRTVAMPL